MSDKNDGGPAFPFDWMDFQPTTGDQVVREQFPGLSIRDWFAGKAMQGILECPEDRVEWDPYITAQNAYKQADAMLKARVQ